MAANVETMFYTRTKPWHGLGVQVQEAPESKDALRLAGLDWKVYQREVYTDSGIKIEGYHANVRNTDNKVLGVVTERYKIVQNEEAFSFTDALLEEGVRYETAGSLQEGKYGFWRDFRKNTLSQESRFPRILYSATAMMEVRL